MFYTFSTVLPLIHFHWEKSLLLDPIHVSEITQITTHDWNVVHVMNDLLLHNRPQLLCIAWIKASSAAIAIASDSHTH